MVTVNDIATAMVEIALSGHGHETLENSDIVQLARESNG